MTVHVKLWVLILIGILTASALYIVFGQQTCAVYIMLMCFSAASWWYQYVRNKRIYEEHHKKHCDNAL